MADKRITHRLRGGLDMLEELRTTGKDCILHDAEIARTVTADWFEKGYWRRKGQWTAVDGGRGAGGRVSDGGKWFLRHYFRGGKAVLLSRDRYLYTAQARVRSFAEFRLLAKLKALGLPTPKPVAARYRRRGLSYTADLITEWIAGARTLANILPESEDPTGIMSRVGTTLAHFHAAGVRHADLNAHNILVGSNGEVWLVDFDRAQLRKPGAWHSRPLQRLRRSLRKLGLDQPDTFDALRRQHDRELNRKDRDAAADGA